MRLTSLQITSATAFDLSAALTAPICVFHGRYSALALDLMRELIGDDRAVESPDRIEDGRFVLHANVKMDDKDYALCYIRNADFMGDKRIAVNFKPGGMDFSRDDTDEYLRKIKKCHTNDSNVFVKSKGAADACLSEGDRQIAAFNRFIEQIPDGDERPLFIYDFFDHIDEAIDVIPYLDRLVALGRQIFVSVGATYPIETLMHDAVRLISTDSTNEQPQELV